MEIGIVGLPKSGKTTVFNALTGRDILTATYTGSGEEMNIAGVKVPDPRLDWLFDKYTPKRKVQLEVKFIDFAPVRKGSGGFSDRHIGDLRNCAALLPVIRAFENESAPHPDGRIDPAADLENLLLEFAMADLQVMEKRAKKIDESFIKMSKEDKALALKEKPVIEKVNKFLEQGKLASDAGLGVEEEKVIRTYGLLTLKPMMALLNIQDNQVGKNVGEQLRGLLPSGVMMLEMAGEIEMEISRLAPEEQKDFLADAGLEEPASARVIRGAYGLLGLIPFYTAGGKDEVAAWQLHEGDTALDAAGKIHSDIARGFIRAEVIAYEDMVKYGDVSAVKEAGRFRLEGKEYTVKDGDIITFRFNV